MTSEFIFGDETITTATSISSINASGGVLTLAMLGEAIKKIESTDYYRSFTGRDDYLVKNKKTSIRKLKEKYEK